MNSYDFDNTLFHPDSSYAFTMFCARRHPFAAFRALPGAAYYGIRHLLKLSDTKALKQRVFYFLNFIKDPEKEVRLFWSRRFDGIEDWYLRQKRDDDIIISASPEFLLRPVAEKLNVRLIATRMDIRTGKIQGNNCHDREKVSRLREEFPGAEIENFYSDSLSDSPMADIADKAYLVKDRELMPWPGKE